MSPLAFSAAKRFDAVAGEQEADRSVPDLVPKLLQDERLQIRLVVDNQNPCGHAARSTRVSISLRSDHEVDRLGEQRLGAIFQRLALGLGIAIGGDHDDRDIRSGSLGLGQEFKPAHPRHVDVGQDQDERSVAGIADALKRRRRGLGKFHGKAASAEIAPELLAEQQLNIGFVINNENEKAHARPPDLAMDRSRARQNDPEFGELAGLGIDLDQTRHVA